MIDKGNSPGVQREYVVMLSCRDEMLLERDKLVSNRVSDSKRLIQIGH